MYMPRHFREEDRALLFDLMRRFSFATLVTTRDGGVTASHLPLLVHPDEGERGTLVGHMARANEQWRDFGAGSEALAIFQGSHAYNSPSWYEGRPAVPTWNYMVVHAYGVPRVLEDEGRVRDALRELVATHEQAFEKPWPMDLPEDYLRGMLRGIVAFEIPIARLEGKFKLSQNRPARDRAGVIAALAGSLDPGAQGVQVAMRAQATTRDGEEDSPPDR